MGKILILTCTGNDWTDNHLRLVNNTDVKAIYRQVGRLFRIIRRIHYRTIIPFKDVWYNEWKENLNCYETIIIFPALLGNEIFEYIRRGGFKGRIICYYRDAQKMKWIKKGCHADEIKALGNDVELWTFDSEDAKNYGMRYSPQFYFELSSYFSEDIKYDAVFIGTVHERHNDIISVYRRIINNNCKANFIVYHEKFSKLDKENGINYITKQMDYEEIIHANCQSKCIVEIMNEHQVGLTVRTLEALFLRRKLITNNISVRGLDFYHPDNVFIDGVDDWDNFTKWLQKPFKEVPRNIRDEYLASSWLKRFFH